MFASMLGFASQMFSLLALNQARGSTYPPTCYLLVVGGRRRWQNEQERSHFHSFLAHQVIHSISQCTGLQNVTFFSWETLLFILPPNLFALWSLYSFESSCRILPQEQSYLSGLVGSDAWTGLKQLSNHLLKFLLVQLVCSDSLDQLLTATSALLPAHIWRTSY